MKLFSFETFKLIATDRYVITLLGVFLLVTIGFCISIGVTLQPSELQIVNQYTAYGITNFYRDKWFYFLSYIVFGFMMAVVHTIIAAKLYQEKDRQFALMFIWLSIAIVAIALILVHSVLQVASLS